MARIELRKVNLSFPLAAGSGASRSFGVLRDINLTLQDGDRVGLVGHNGAGKSTLLRLMAGIYPCDSGTLVREGRVVALLSMGLGLNMELSGRHNIPLIALHLAISPRRLTPLLDSIIAWTELGDFIEQPLRTYSSGMLIRLIFAVYTAVPPEILLLDEWLGVGDERFQVRAQERMASFVDQTRIMVVATHSRELRERWCNRIVELKEGRIVSDAAMTTGLDQ